MSHHLTLQKHVKLAGLTTMNVGGPAAALVVAQTRDDVVAAVALAAERQLRLFVLGEGSNVVVSDAPIHRLVLRIAILGRHVVAEDAASVTVKVGAGEHWDDVVAWAVDQGLAGIEAMSMIPGTAGAAPVQNAGAYGQEAADTLVEVEAYDLSTGQFVTLPRADCGFAYRYSHFKGDWAGRFIIIGLTLRLSKQAPAEPTYASLRRYLEEAGIVRPTLAQIRTAVMAVRGRILPDPSVVPNAGSFFKNPIVDAATVARLRQTHPELPVFVYGERFKVSAGWLLDQCGFKGQAAFGLEVWPHHALVITNPNSAGYDDLCQLVDLMVATVHEKFGITLEMEPVLISD